jgi:hypothetical protein
MFLSVQISARRSGRVFGAVVLAFASWAGESLHAHAQARKCDAISDPHAFNLCLAASGPAARRTSAGARPAASALEQDVSEVENSARNAAPPQRRASQYLNLGTPVSSRPVRTQARIPRH